MARRDELAANNTRFATENTLVGYAGKRGKGYHFYATDSNTYDGSVPLEEIDRRLLNWHAVEQPLTYDFLSESGVTRMTDESRKLLVASDNGELLGIHGAGRPTRQYRDALINQVATLLDTPGSELGIGSVGFLNNRKKMWINIEMAETMQVDGTDIEFSPFLMAATSHDATISWTFKALTELLICGNMVSGIIRRGQGGVTGSHKVKATRHSELNILTARQNLGLVFQNGEKFAEEIKLLTEQTVTDRQWQAIVNAFAPLPKDEASKKAVTQAENKRELVTELWNNSPMVSPWKNTTFGAFQALNTYAHHHQGVKSSTQTERNLERAVKQGAGSVEEMDYKIMETIDKVLAHV